MKLLLRLALVLLTTGCFNSILADGMVIPQVSYALTRIPDQRALIHYSNGVECLVIETSFAGPGTNFAWVVPLPAVPTVEPVSRAVFSTLHVGFQPRITLEVAPWWIAAALLGLVAWLIALVVRGILSQGSLIVLFVVLVVLLLGVLAPASGHSKAAAAAPALATLSDVRVLQRQQVGVYETVTLSSTDPAALESWLNTQGFRTPLVARPVIADYVREGWVFVAARVSRALAGHAAGSPHPLSFTFRTSEPIYPLRLTGLGGGPCAIDLYVFGPQRAEAPGFRVSRCDRPTYGEKFAWPRTQGGVVRVRHQELADLVHGAPVATKLSATLSPDRMRRDLYLRWVPYRAQGAEAFTAGAAASRAANVATIVALVAGVAAWFGWGRLGRRALPRWWFATLITASIVLGVAVFGSTPRVGTTEMRTVRVWHRNEARMLALSLRMAIEDELQSSTNASRPDAPWLSPERLSRLVDELGPYYLGRWSPGSNSVPNVFTGLPLRLEKSPGNIWVQPGTNGLEVVWYDLDGAPGTTNGLW